jgi:protection-of-telomeres protein 1
VASGYDRVPWAIFRQSEKARPSASLICSPKSVEPTQQERAYANSLLNLVAQTSVTEQPRQRIPDNRSTVIPAVPPKKTAIVKKRDRFSLIKDVSPDTYVDLVAQVVKTFPEQDKFLLYVTDYTANKALFEYAQQSDDGAQDRPGDQFGYIRRSKRPWQGPFGQMTLQVALWEPHSYFARQNVKEDDYVHLRNVHIKSNPVNGMLEGGLHTDKIYPEKICVHAIGDDDDSQHVVELKRRKREYWKRNQLGKAQIAEDFGNLDDGPQDRASKKNAKKRKKEQQQKKKPMKREEGQTEITATLNTKRYELNKNSKFLFGNFPSIREIADDHRRLQSKPGILAFPVDQ